MERDNISEKRFRKTESIVFRKIGNECILVPISRRIEDINCFYTLNDVAVHIWEALDGNRTVGEIKNGIVQKWNVHSQTAEQDLVEFLQQLISVGALKEATHGMSEPADTPGV
jgi:hypothetical protein